MSILTRREYPAKFKRIIDGDTFELWFDYGFDSWQGHQVRLKDYDTPERGHSKYEDAKNMSALIMQTRDLLVTTYKRESGTYDMSVVRYVCDVYVLGEPQIGNLGAYLTSMGLALPWNGKGPHPWASM
jgi:endonuclease YncB( thermonuclease family)